MLKKTKIICTQGPATDPDGVVDALIENGMNCARFNFSHGTHPEHMERIKKVRAAAERSGKVISLILDTKGPEIRLRDFKNGSEELLKDAKFTLTTRELLGDNTIVSVSYADLPKDVKAGGSILIDDGLIELRVDEIDGTEIHCTVVNGGKVSNHKGVNIPGADLSMPFISEQDRSDIEFGCKLGFDYVAASFTRTADDIRAIREILDAQGSKMKIIAKIESVQGVKNIKEIFKAADGVMVARGDLGVEVPAEDVPAIQKDIIKLGAKMGKIVITATQMLDSMIHNPRPTRAEVTDVANAIYDGTAAIMLSGETAAGSYPVEAVEMMSKIAEKTEQEINYSERRRRLESEKQEDATTAISHATCTLAEDVRARAIITVTISGFTARRLAKYRPECTVIACTVSQTVACQMNLLFGVIPVLIPQEDNADMLFDAALHEAKKRELVSEGDTVILTAGLPLGVSGNTNMIRVMEVI